MEFIFATNNKHKLEEVKHLFANRKDITIKSLAEIGFNEEIPETHETLSENAFEKSEHIFKRFNVNCFADDTGLEIEALNGAPGVYSARYAGVGCSFQDNVNKTLLEMKGKTNRKARFRTVVSLILEGKEYQFEGIVDGEILTEPTGKDGFGYDPIFKPTGYDQSFAEMDLDEKNKISHRARAFNKFAEFLISIK
ncbi:MAG: RdgB/HAM1 family non-canonical purine NTP pyrophosphatase [Bacteroidota bacterium]